MSGMIFERKEIKYLLSREQAEAFRALAGERLQIDEYGKSLLLSLYFLIFKITYIIYIY